MTKKAFAIGAFPGHCCRSFQHPQTSYRVVTEPEYSENSLLPRGKIVTNKMMLPVVVSGM